ncbi:MAG: pilus assembly protein, partial [Actinomycetota bacterium]
RDDRGCAVIEFALAAPLVLGVAVGGLLVVLALQVLSTLPAAAAEGARAGALAGSSTLVAERRTREVLSDALGGDAAESVKAQRIRLDGVPAVRVSVSGRLPLIGLLGPSTLTVDGHAMQEIP